MTEKERLLLQYLQDDFPLAARPFALAGARFGISEDEVLAILARLERRKVIRYLGAIFDPKRLGIHSVLCAADVAPRDVAAVARAISSLREVSHNYLRQGNPNLWFTVSAGSAEKLARTLKDMRALTGGSLRSFPVIQTFKIDARFHLIDRGRGASGSVRPRARSSARACRVDKKTVIALNRPFPLVRRPFARAASGLGISEPRLWGLLERYKKAGVLRRFGIILGHRHAGFRANCMVAWRVPPAKLSRAARVFRAARQITHCYERATAPDWPYNVYTMIHCAARAECSRLIRALALSTGITEYRAFFTVREFKKTKADLAAVL